jgi:hypothetical protein
LQKVYALNTRASIHQVASSKTLELIRTSHGWDYLTLVADAEHGRGVTVLQSLTRDALERWHIGFGRSARELGVKMKHTILSLCGALAGAALGYFAFSWLVTQGFYALALPGGLLGLGAGIGKNRSIVVAIICGVAATALGLYSEWRFAPFVADDSVGYFFAHAYRLQPLTLVMILVGSLIGFWVPYRRMERSTATEPKTS